MYANMYRNGSYNAPSYTHISLYVICMKSPPPPPAWYQQANLDTHMVTWQDNTSLAFNFLSPNQNPPMFVHEIITLQ